MSETRRRPIGRRLLRLAAWLLLVAVLALGAGWLLLTSGWGHERVRLLIEARMSEYLDRDVEIRDVDYALRPGRFILRDLVIPSPRPGDPDFARVPRVELQFSVSGFSRLTLDIARVEVERPVVQVVFYEDGANNLPELQRPQREGPGRVEVKVGRLLVMGGTLHFDHLVLPLEIDAGGVRAVVRGAGEAPGGGDRFQAVVSARRLDTLLPDARPWGGSAAARGVFSPGRIDVAGGRLRGPDLDARFQGYYAWGEVARQGVIEVDARGAAALANRLGYVEDELAGPFRFTGAVDIDAANDITWAGRLRSPELTFGSRVFGDLAAALEGDGERLLVDVERATYAGGRLEGVVRVELGGGEGGRPVEVVAQAAGLSLPRVIADLELETDALSRLTGRAGGELTYRFTSDDPLRGSGEARVRLAAVGGAAEGLPLAGRAALDIRGGVLASDDIVVTAPEQRVVGSGRYDLAASAGSFDFRLTTGDLPRLLAAVPALDPDPAAPPAWYPTSGAGTARGSLRVGPEELTLQATVDLREVASPALALSRLTAPVTYRDGVLATDDLVAVGPEQQLLAAGSYDVEAGRGSFDLRLRSDDLGDLAGLVPLPEGERPAWLPTGGSGSAEGNLAIAPGPTASGRATFDLVGVETPGGRFERVSGALAFTPDAVRDLRVEAVADGGALVAVGGIPLPLDSGELDLVVEMEDFPLERVQPFAPQLPALTGRVSGRLDLAGRLDDLEGELEVATGPVTVRGAELEAVEGRLAFRGSTVEVERLDARADGGRLAATGTVRLPLSSEGTRLTVQVVDFPLERVAPLVPQLPAVTGRVSGNLEVAGGLEDLRGDLAVVTGPLTVEGVALEGLRGRIAVRGRRVFVQRLVAEAGGGRLVASGLLRWPLTEGELDLHVQAVDFPLELLAPFVPQMPEVEGRLSGRFDLSGGLATLRGIVEVDTGPVVIAGIRLTGLQGLVRLDGTRVVVERLAASAPAGTVLAQGAWNRASGAIALRVAADDLELAAEPFAELLAGDLAGRADLLATVGGTLERPHLELRLAARELELQGRPLGDEGHAVVAALWNGRALVAQGSLLGLVSFDGGGALTTEAADLAFAVESDALGGLVQLVSEASLIEDLEGGFRGSVKVAGRFDRPGGPDVALRLPRLVARYEGQEIENLEPVVLHYRPGRLDLDSLYLGVPGGDSELFVAGTVGLGADLPLDLRLQADVAASWLEIVIPDVELEGEVELLAVVDGTPAEPRLNGQGAIVGGEALVANFPHALENLRAVVLLYPERVVLDSLTAQVAGGDLRAAGRVDLVDLSAGRVDYHLQAQVTDVAVRYPEGFLLRGDGNFTLTSRAEGRAISGVVSLDRAFYLQDVPAGLSDLLFTVFERTRLEVAEPDEALAGTQLNVVVEGPGALRVRNNVADLEGDVDLVIRGTLAQPVIFGQVEVEPGGEVVYAENDYRVERGLLTFANPSRIDPVIDFSATTEVRSYDITLNLTGTLDRLNTTFSSDPPLADLEVVALLTTGQEIRESGRLFTGEGSGAPGVAAQQFLYGQAASVISERVNTLFGFDRFRVAPVAAGGAGGSSLAFTVGKQISRDLFVTYSRDPSTPELDVLQIEWQADENIVVVFTQRGESAYAVDVRVERRF